MTQWQPPPGAQYGGPPPGYPPPGYPPPGYPPPGYPQPGYGYGYPAYGYYGDGPPGQIRRTGISILLFVCTLGIYGFVYNYSVHDEMRRHTGRGIGGGVALLLTFLAWVAMPFVTPAEVGSMYIRRGQQPPVNGWTGLWTVVPWIGGYLMYFFVIFASFASTPANSDFGNVAAGAAIGLLVWFGAVIAGGIIGFVKTNDALNAYWASLGVQPR